MATQTNKPAHTLRCGGLKATIWKNSGERGPFYSATFSRPFKGAKGQWRNSTSFGLADLEAITILTAQAKAWIFEHAAR